MYTFYRLILYSESTMGGEVVPLHPEREVAGLYCMDKDGSIKKHVDKINISNGLAWSADNSLMYYIDSLPRKVYVFDYDITTGTPCTYTLFYSFQYKWHCLG